VTQHDGEVMSQCILITGATAGFGLATARLFADRGWRLVLTGRRAERLAVLKNELENLTPVHCITLDVRDNDAVMRAIAQLPEAFSDVSVLVNNAGLALGTDPAYQAKLSDWQTMIDTNVTGLVNVTHAMLPLLMKQTPATVVNLSSIAANWPYPSSHVYGASKAFVRQFSYNLRCDLAGKGVRVTSLEPGMAESEFSLVRFKGDKMKADALYKGANAIKPEDIAHIIEWIVTQPAHLNINSLEVMPASQAWNNFQVVREPSSGD
jgi:sulfoacetaldehyde reductase